MSNMGLLETICFSLALMSFTQIHHTAEALSQCQILSATASGASSILVNWEHYPGATSYLLDLREKNSPDSAPVVTSIPGYSTGKNVQGLSPGTEYKVTLKVFIFYFVECVNTTEASTVPDKSQILEGRALSSTSVFLKWRLVTSSDWYYLEVYSHTTGLMLNFTYTNTTEAVVRNLQSSTDYDCYIYTANEAGLGSASKVNTITTLVSPPEGIEATQTGQDTAKVTWQPVKDVLLYQVIIQDQDDPTIQPSVHNITDTKLDMHGILPCSNYLILVSSFNKFLVPSEPSNHTYTTNKLTPVSSVSVDYFCTANSVTVSWSSVFGADTYKATAIGNNGTEMSCTSHSTNCDITGLNCGQDYEVHVTPMSENCENLVNATMTTFHTVPCPPGNLDLVRECNKEVIHFSWSPTVNADHYFAQAVDSQGRVHPCLTEDNFCNFTRVVCGRRYDFTVYSITGGCDSDVSSTVSIHTAPCIPHNLQTSANCSSDILLSTWDHAEGAQQYTVNAVGNRRNSSYSCTSMSNSCAMEGLTCGEHLSINIIAFDSECASPPTLGLSAETVPCAPYNVSAVKDCGANSLNVTWKMNSGALFYVAVATDLNGVVHSCNSMIASCNIGGLKCSTHYNIHVIASNFMCNSTQSETITMETAACPPDSLVASLDCAANEALISWNGQPQINSFTASVVDEDEGLLSCSSTTTSCKIPNLKCGQLYTVTVSHHDGICPSMPSEPIYMESVPCGPANVQTDVDCESGGISISWSETSDAEGYTVVISDSSTQMSFNSTEPELSVDTLECGKEYGLRVMSFNKSCSSFATELTVREAPCVPTNLITVRNCSQSFAEIMWQESRGAKNYTAAAVDEDGNRTECLSDKPWCRLEGIMCSQIYEISVAAIDEACTSMRSTTVTLETEPCPPSQLTVSVTCSSNSAVLSWDSSIGAASYTGRAVSSDGHNVTCDPGLSLGCLMEGLRCGMEYSFSVSASNGDCQSVESDLVKLTTAPCAVQSVITTINCSTNVLTASWMPGSLPVNHSVAAVSADGTTTLRCVTEDSHCALTGLQCGQGYSVVIKPISSTCEGPESEPEVVNSVPCIPANVQTTVECSINTLQASWDAADGAVSYICTLTETGGFSSSCPTADQSCQFTSLQCAQEYVFSVRAINDKCNSSWSTDVTATTAPCDPTNVSASLECVSGVATVVWTPSAGADDYTVIAETIGHSDSCVSTGVSCELSQLQCGEDYTVMVLAGDAKCNSSVLAKTYITTAPCPPTIEDHSLNCTLNSALITWVVHMDALLVTITASSHLGHSQSCSSSSISSSSCVLEDLQCGNTYNVEAVAHGAQCESNPSSAFQIVTAPCTPTNVDYLYSCETGINFISWDETLGNGSFYISAEAGDHITSISTEDTNCSFSELLCSRTYDVQVVAVAEHCNSSVPAAIQIPTAPCAPMNVGASLLCDDNTAEVTWEQSVGAVMYNVTATGSNGDIKQCRTDGTSCQMTNMQCAEIYIITVIPFSTSCQGEETLPYTYVSGPCPPSNIQVSLQCAENIGLVTWEAATQADMYEATAKSLDMHVYNCSTSGTGCSFTELNCGESLAVTVVTVERGCRSEPSEFVTLQSVICPPSGLVGLATCSNNDITVSWDPSLESDVEYFIHSQEEGGVVANYSTTQTSHVITGLQCGEMYSARVAASNSECTSIFSETINTDTAPCPPDDLTVETECGTNLATLVWAQSSYAVSYTATLNGTHGHVVSCSTNSTLNCSMSVDCGRQYSGVVVASSETCNSSTSAMITFDSAPCLPENVQAELDCDTNAFSVQWEGSTSNVGIYTAMAIGSDGSRETCDSSKANCTIQNVKCGLTYSLLVTTSAVDCGIIKGSNYKMQSAPCKPDSVSVDLECSTHEAFITWENSGPDQTQEVSAVDSKGIINVLHSNSSNCTFEQLSCGEIYMVSVVGHTDSCSSEPALAEQLTTAPCIPTHVMAQVDCDTGITVVTWDSAMGATSYTVYAQGNLGHYDECTSIDTNCNFQDLACGQHYNITVVARHDTCESLVSKTVTATTGPCPHSSLATTLNCDTNSAMVSWTPGSGLLYYNASADAFDIDHEETCSTTNSSCNITSLRCGESYKVSVSGQGQHCPSPPQDWHRVNTAPCPPTQLSVTSSCQSNNITVSWEASQGSVSYTVVAEDADSRQWSCDTESNSCQISNLLCGQEYSVYVVGVDENCIGSRSEVAFTQTAPCIPESIQNQLDCVSGSLNTTWQSTGHFLQFQASVRSTNGFVSICDTSEHHCVVQNLDCGLTYNVTLVAMDETCNSSSSPVKQVTTAPCPLTSFKPTVDCHTGSVSITWNNSVSEVFYRVTAIDAMNRAHNCSSTNIGCNLTALECGTEYNISITPSRNDCVGRESVLKRISTVPCIPHLSEVEIDCLTNSAWVMYNESVGAENYVVTATDRMGDMWMFECNSTSEGMCSLPPLACSQNLTFTLRVQDQQCTSAPSNAVTTETAPCPPENVTESVDCDDGTISISWATVPGAISYTATLEELSGGKTTCCTASDTDCDVTDLPCGQMYVLHVTAEGQNCNSSESERIITRTVPCVPENPSFDLSCINNVASVSWSSSELGQLYTATAVGDDGHVHDCQSPSSQCDITDLHCGEFYTVTVTAEDMVCTSKPSDSVLIKTVPCTPENTSVVMDCESNSLVVSWSDGVGADSYIATLQDSSGQSTTCLGTTGGSCNVTGVGCGQIYQVFVVSSDGYCDSLPTPQIDTPSVPCKPTNIEAVVDCSSQSALVSWYPSDGAESYTVLATSASGSTADCETSMTSCELEGLSCGQRYSLSLAAVGESCSSIELMTGELVTAPCHPEILMTQYSVTIGQALWGLTAGADYYVVTAETNQGLTTSCNTTETYCPLYNMECGQIYNITVSASNHVCEDVSTSLEDVTIMTEPCPPNNVQTSLSCETNQGSVSWEPSRGALNYIAHLAGNDGHSLSCYTSNTSCSVEGLHCGVIYHTSVMAIGETLNSSSSATVFLLSAPCASGEINATLDCSNNTATVSWSSATGANSYTVTAVSADGYLASCESNDNQCELTDLKCGQTYNITVRSTGDQCQAETQSDATLRTRPCEVLGVGVDLQCGTSVANMYWDVQEQVDYYVATASYSTGTTLCNSTTSTCQFTNLLCGETYELSVRAYNSLCLSEDSSIEVVQTDPCQPTEVMVNNGTCNNDTVLLEWSEAKGALFYTLAVTGDLGFTRTFQTSSTLLEADLPCGQLFTFTVVAQDDRCESAVSLPEQHKTGPCIPEHVQSFISCEDSLGAVSWAMSAGAETYLAVAVGLDGHTHECTSNTTSCFWNDLHCGELYTVHVIANDYLCTSLPSNSTTIRMAPCTPQNLTIAFNCSTKVGSLSWNVSETAEFYIVTAENNDSHKVQLSTNDSWTYISEFQCSQQYYLSVQAADSMCTSISSQPLMLVSEPCAPTNVSSYMDCISNIAVVSWTGSARAEFYTATVTTEDGQSYSCWSDNEHCGMPNVQCGEAYSVTVVASNTMCDSDPSDAETLKSVPCVPSDVDVAVDCVMNQAVVSWSASDGALSYEVTAQSTLGDVSACEAADLSCTLTGLMCGHNYSVQVVALDDSCSSLPSQSLIFNSVPCSPVLGSIVLDCYTNTALLDWAFAEGAMYYRSTAQSPNGNVITCATNFTNCELMNLQCGQIYNVMTVAVNDQCSSIPSSSLQVESVPCPPEGVVPALDCSTNTASVQWLASPGAQAYIVQALGIQEHETTCETNTQSCLLTDLMCGFTYNISVIAANSVCNVSQSDVQQLQAVPCVPQQVAADVLCESGSVAVSWEPSKGASSYLTAAQGNGGYASLCNSSETTCVFNDLLCGLNYTITVIGSDETCSSAESWPVGIASVPCAPQRATAEMTCSNDTGLVSWEEADDVSAYKVVAVGPDGHMVECNSTESSCQLSSMHCGQRYNVTATAQDGRCDNSHAHLSLQSAPCRPTSVKASLRCNSNSVAVTWEQASGALSYAAIGVTATGSHQAECNNTMPYCDLSDLQCGQTYNVSVFSLDESCSSRESDQAYVRTAPCPPQNVAVDAHCSEESMEVSWSPDPDAEYFHVAAVSDTGARLYCNSTTSSCSLGDLPCGQKYNITVLSVREDCESKPSLVAETSSAPCVARNAHGQLDCVSNSAWVVWDQSEGATEYFVFAESTIGHRSNCTASSSPCSVPDLECGALYSFNVVALNKHCSSNDNTSFELETGPCALQAIIATTECNSDTILVEWEQIMETQLYLVTAEDDNQTLISCNSSSNFCVLEDVHCGSHYNIIVSASSDKCSSLRSPPKKILTAPCVPEEVTVETLCEENGAAVSWTHSSVATAYHLTAMGSDGHIVSCNTSVNNCSLSQLKCGQTYNLSITARGGNCTSPPSRSSFTTVPCAPVDLVVDFDCKTTSASLSWDSSEGAMEYFSCAEPSSGDLLYCNGSDPFCTFEQLECGTVYNFSVKASNGVCNSSISLPLQAGAAPCPPANVRVRIQKLTQAHWAMVSWDHVNCSNVEYMTEVTGRIQNDPQMQIMMSSYWLPRPYFEVPLPCSTAYNVTVSSRNSASVSQPSSPITGVTVPCPPQNVQYTGSSQAAVLSWDSSLFATNYTVYGMSEGSRVTLCTTSLLSCQLTNSDPSTTQVTAINAVGESSPSQNVTGPIVSRRRRDLLRVLPYTRLE